MIFETERLYTREMTISDLNALAKILQDPQVMYAYEHPFSEEETLNWLNRQLERYQEFGHGLWGLVLKKMVK